MGERVTRKMKQLAAQMKRDLREGMFNEEVTDGIEMIRSIVDMKGLAGRVKAHGAVNVGHMDGQSFAENMKKLTNSVDNIPNEKLEDAFTKFLKSLSSTLKAKALTKLTANRFSETTSTQKANSMLAMKSSSTAFFLLLSSILWKAQSRA